MEQHWKLRDLGLTIVFSVIYFAVVLAATIMGGIHPLLYLFVTALIALVAWIPYMYVMAKVPKAGVVLIMNLFVAIAFVAFGELANLLLSLIHISEPTRRTPISYAVFCLKKKKTNNRRTT